MFDKEAEEYKLQYSHYEVAKREDGTDYAKCVVNVTIQEAFQKGAEFGYNKANEWHYVKDGDLPRDEKDMLMTKHLILLTKMKGSDCLSLALGQYNFSLQEFSYQHIIGLTEVIAWKEIILPKEN